MEEACKEGNGCYAGLKGSYFASHNDVLQKSLRITFKTELIVKKDGKTEGQNQHQPILHFYVSFLIIFHGNFHHVILYPFSDLHFSEYKQLRFQEIKAPESDHTAEPTPACRSLQLPTHWSPGPTRPSPGCSPYRTEGPPFTGPGTCSDSQLRQSL